MAQQRKALVTWQHGAYKIEKTCVFVDISPEMSMEDIVTDARKQVYEALQLERRFCNCRGPYTRFLSYPREQPDINAKVEDPETGHMKMYHDVINQTLPEVTYMRNAVVLFSALDG